MNKNDQVIPASKEKLFTSIIKCYEDKEYKKGIKAADTLLKEFPQNARTLCMKHLMIYLISKDKEAGEKDIKAALRLDPKNGTCWQTLGLFYRHGKNYMEARKAFQNATTFDSTNLQLTIDLSVLHAQMRDFTGFRICHQKVIAQLPNRSSFWLGFMTGYFLEGKYDKCLEVIHAYRKTLDKTPSTLRQELILLEVECQLKLSKPKDAISVLRNGMNDILSEDSAKERLAVIYGEDKQFDESFQLWKELFNRNSENYRYLRGMECCRLGSFKDYSSYVHLQLPSSTLSLTTEQTSVLTELYSQLTKDFPRSNALRYVQLQFINGSGFKQRCDEMVCEALRKGIPSFFHSLLPMIRREPTMITVLHNLVLNHYLSLKETGLLANQIGKEEEEPSVLLWVLLLLAEIEDYLYDTKKALEWLSLAYKHTPTCYDLYVIQARVYRHAGYLQESERVMSEGSSLDRGDRYLNTKHTKYLLKCNEIEKADEEVSYWTKKDSPSRIDLNNLQANWFEVECGWAYWRRGDIVHANKLFHNVIEHFDVYYEDQFDFHSYSLRQSHITDYLKFLSYTDNLYDHPYYRSAACGLLLCSIALHHQPFNKEDYFTRYPQIQLNGDIMKADEQDHDVDGISLASHSRPLLTVISVVKMLLKVADRDISSLETIAAWAATVKNSATAVSVLKAMVLLSPIRAAATCQSLVQQNVLKEDVRVEILGEKTDDEIIAGLCGHRIHDLMALGDLKGLNHFMENVKDVERDSLELYGDCYRWLKEKNASEDEKNVFVVKAKEYFIYFEKYLEINGLN